MAALDNIQLDVSEVQEMVTSRDVKSWVKVAFWAWFDANENDEVLVVKVWVIRKTIRLKDLQFVFEKFFGSYLGPSVRGVL